MKPEQITAFPVTPGESIDIYHKGKPIYIYPDNAQLTVKWVSFLDKLMENKKTLQKRQVCKQKMAKTSHG